MLRLRFPPEPYADVTMAAPRLDGTRLPDSEPFVADSAAARLLREELLRYCRGEINGRSFLIGAARGGGKTTLVRSVVQRVEREDSGNTMLRPLLISLHGPDLWKQTSRPKEGGLKETVTTDTEKDGVKIHVTGDRYPILARDPSEVLLDQIILRTHRAFAWSLSRQYRDSADKELASSSILSSAQRSELHERCAQLPLALFQDHPSPAELRSYWNALPRALVDGVTPGNFEWRRGSKGANELLALAGIVDAYRRISGKFERTEKQSSSSTLDSQSSISGKSTMSEWLPALLGVSAAGAAGGTALIQNLGAPLSALIAAFAGLFTLSFSQTRQQKKTYSIDDSFIPDASSQTLKRVVPIMFNWLRDAGYAPVILIDELDKIGFDEEKNESPEDRLTNYIDNIASQLKDLVAERAIFCFLVNRGQFTVIDDAINSDPVGVASSFFSHRLMHHIAPSDWSDYLNKSIEVKDAEKTPSDLIAKRRLQSLFAYRSRLQPLAMQRILREFSEQERVRLPGGVDISALGTRGYTIPIAIQILTEFALTHPALDSWLKRNPNYNQIALDSLYFLAHLWESERGAWRDPRVDAGFKDLLVYLDAQGHPQAKDVETHQAMLDVLRDWSGQIMEWMSSDAILANSDFVKWLNDYEPQGYLRDTIKIGIPALSFNRTSNIFRRIYDHAGNARNASEFENWKEQVDKIKKCRELLNQILKDFGWPAREEVLDVLANRYRVLDLAPAWKSAEDAIRRLDQTQGRRLDSTTQDAAQTAIDYAQILDRASGLLWHVLVCAMVATRYLDGANNKSSGIQVSLKVISQALRLQNRDSEAAKVPAQELLESFLETLGEPNNLPSPQLDGSPLEQVLGNLLDAKKSLVALNPGSFILDSNQVWQDSLTRTVDALLIPDSVIDPTAGEVLWSARNEGPFKYGLQLDFRSMNLLAWGQMLMNIAWTNAGVDAINLRNIGLHAIGFRLAELSHMRSNLIEMFTADQSERVESFILENGLWKGDIACIVLVLTLENRSVLAGLQTDSRAAILVVPESQKESALLMMARLRTSGLPCFCVREYDVQSTSLDVIFKTASDFNLEGMRQFVAFASWPFTQSPPSNALLGIKDSRELIDKLLNSSMNFSK